jgi:hypothetical protein
LRRHAGSSRLVDTPASLHHCLPPPKNTQG